LLFAEVRIRHRNHREQEDAHGDDQFGRQHSALPFGRLGWFEKNYHKTPPSIIAIKAWNVPVVISPTMIPLSKTHAVVIDCAAACSCWNALASSVSSQPLKAARNPFPAWRALVKRQ